MDDPWGSPWTSTDQKPPSPVKPSGSSGFSLGLEPPPRARLSNSNSPRITAFPDDSPWAENDDAFGDWSTPDQNTATQPAWDGGWNTGPGAGTDTGVNLSLASKADAFGKASPIAWPGNLALPSPSTSPSRRQPSPSLDPWSRDFGHSNPNSTSTTPRLVPLRSDAASDDAPSETGDDPSAHDPSPQSIESDPVEDDPWARKDEILDPPPVDTSDHISVSSKTQDDHSVHTSSSHDDSDHEGDQQDSPITSIDEDGRARAKVQRTVSGKVQELVQKFDGIARLAVEPSPPPPLVRERGRSRGPSMSAPPENSADMESSPMESTPRPLKTYSDIVQPPQESQPTPSIAPAPSIAVRDLISQFGEIRFQIPEDILPKLFDSDKLAAMGSSSGATDVSERIISDSFTQISERKVWYRVARQGSSRRHNAGDDDSYRRVTWPTSAIHMDTIKTVRRWMEEDSVAGRVTLGGMPGRSTMFGWDSAAEPVSLDSVFKSRAVAQPTHARTGSLASTGTPISATTQPSHGFEEQSPQVATGASAAFGWSSGPAQQQPRASVSFPPPPAQLASMADAPRPSLSIPLPPPVAAPVALARKPAALQFAPKPSEGMSKNDDEDEDDDDWGEMISSPQAAHSGIVNSQWPQPVSALLDATDSPVLDANSFLASDHTAVSHSNGDPWGTVDFSLLEPEPAKHKVAVSSPVASRKPGAAPPSVLENRPSPEVVSPPIASVATTQGFPEADDPDLVRRFTLNLPDLSYMLR